MSPEAERSPNPNPEPSQFSSVPLSGGATVVEYQRWLELVSRPREQAPVLDALKIAGLGRMVFDQIVPSMREVSHDRTPDALGLPYLCCGLGGSREGRGDVLGVWVEEPEDGQAAMRIDLISDARIVTNPRAIARVERVRQQNARGGDETSDQFDSNTHAYSLYEERDDRYVAYVGDRKFLFDRKDCRIESSINHPDPNRPKPELLVHLPGIALVGCSFDSDRIPEVGEVDENEPVSGSVINLVIDYQHCPLEDREGVQILDRAFRGDNLRLTYADGIVLMLSRSSDSPDMRINGQEYKVFGRRLVRPMTMPDLELILDRVCECSNWLQQITQQWD